MSGSILHYSSPLVKVSGKLFTVVAIKRRPATLFSDPLLRLNNQHILEMVCTDSGSPKT